MNKSEFIGRTTKNIDLQHTSGGTSFVRFDLAVGRKLPDKNGDRITDFIPCVAFGKLAETVSKYVNKGDRVYVAGELQFDTYSDRNGQKHTNANVVINEVEFLESKKVESSENQTDEQQGLTPIQDSSLPF